MNMPRVACGNRLGATKRASFGEMTGCYEVEKESKSALGRNLRLRAGGAECSVVGDTSPPVRSAEDEVEPILEGKSSGSRTGLKERVGFRVNHVDAELSAPRFRKIVDCGEHLSSDLEGPQVLCDETQEIRFGGHEVDQDVGVGKECRGPSFYLFHAAASSLISIRERPRISAARPMEIRSWSSAWRTRRGSRSSLKS